MMSFRQYRHIVASGQAPTSHEVSVPREARRYQGQPAGLVSRALSTAIDLGVVYLAVAGAYLGMRALIWMLPSWLDVRMPPAQAFAVGAILLLWAYGTVSWATAGRSFGQHLMGLRVEGRYGRHPDWAVSAVRTAACIAFPLGLLWVPVSRSQRSLQDLVLRTRVIHDWVTQLPTEEQQEMPSPSMEQEARS
jgi:uncharacterized RDD family membrane protein YckC